MKGKSPKERGVLVRAVKFEIKPSPDQEKVLLIISANLRQVWNRALTERQVHYQAYLEWVAPKLEQLNQLAEGSLERHAAERLLERERKMYFQAHPGPTLFDQINTLTGLRQKDAHFASVPRNWQEETLDRLNGSFLSWMRLRQKGDPDARTPRMREESQFQVLPGRMGFSLEEKCIRISCKNVAGDVDMRWPIPSYQLNLLEEAKHTEPKRFALKKFVLSREPNDLTKPGRYWMSLIYEREHPEDQVITRHNTVYLALGASSLGFVSEKGEAVIRIWRPDTHWMPKVESVRNRQKERQKGSRGWKRLQIAKRTMETLAANQRRQHFYEIAERLLQYGCHFIVKDYVVRSKAGKLADAEKSDRGGLLGRNWAAQNTGSLSELVLILGQKAEERGGSLKRVSLTIKEKVEATGKANKLQLARALRDQNPI